LRLKLEAEKDDNVVVMYMLNYLSSSQIKY